MLLVPPPLMIGVFVGPTFIAQLRDPLFKSVEKTVVCDENTISILTNPSFENGSFSCWESNGATTILESEYDDKEFEVLTDNLLGSEC